MQNAAFEARRIDAVYIPVSIPPDRIRKSLAGLKRAGFSGFNVTVPYKETVIPFLDGMTDTAKTAGAVNTIAIDRRSGRWVGHNTDVHGVGMMLRAARINPAGKKILLIGAGGAAKAVCVAMLGLAKSIAILNRTPSRARRLRNSFGAVPREKISVLPTLAASGEFDILINATSVGLKNSDKLALPAELFKNASAAVDLIYNPPVTNFLRAARRAGCRAVNGVDMLLHQGARAFELWTGRPAPVAVMRRALAKAIRR